MCPTGCTTTHFESCLEAGRQAKAGLPSPITYNPETCERTFGHSLSDPLCHFAMTGLRRPRRTHKERDIFGKAADARNRGAREWRRPDPVRGAGTTARKRFRWIASPMAITATDCCRECGRLSVETSELYAGASSHTDLLLGTE
jgi:hypothetical protein